MNVTDTRNFKVIVVACFNAGYCSGESCNLMVAGGTPKIRTRYLASCILKPLPLNECARFENRTIPRHPFSKREC
jgi:hypothetical protein